MNEEIEQLKNRIAELEHDAEIKYENHKRIVADLTEQADRWEDDALRLMKERNEALRERDEARQEVCFLLSRNATQGCDGDTPEFHATARGWCYLLEEDGK